MSSAHNQALNEAELGQALQILNGILAQKGVDFGVIDIDIVIHPDEENDINADKLSRWLYEQNPHSFAKVDHYGVSFPAIRLTRDNEQLLVEVEIFDVIAWPERTQYDLRAPDNDRTSLMVHQAQIPILSPRWLLREKIISQYGRQGSSKEATDIDDIDQLTRVVQGGCLTFNRPEQVQALKALLMKRPGLMDRLRSKIVCAEVFNAT